MNGITELEIFYLFLSMIGFAFIFAILIGFIMFVFKKILP